MSPSYPTPRELRRRALGLARDADYVLRLVRDEQQTPDRVAYVLLSSVARDLVLSGRFHVARGVLTGEGHALVSVFTRCMLDLEGLGHHGADETAEALRRLRDEVGKLG